MSLWRAIRETWQGRHRLRDLVGINRRNVELVYAHNRRRDYPLVDDKILCKERLEQGGVPVAPTIAACRGLFDIPRVAAILRTHDQLVVKPSHGSGGDGIVVCRARTDSGWIKAGGGHISEDALWQHLAAICFGAFSRQLDDRVLVEERIHPHPFFRALYADGLCDVRLIMLEGRCLMAMVRVPTRESGGRANLHQGGIGVAVDVETGRTTRAVWHRTPVETHPENGFPMIVQQIPDWDQIREVGRRAAACVPLGYIGVDIVLDAARGPLVLELNARPGLEIQNINGRPLGPALEGGAP